MEQVIDAVMTGAGMLWKALWGLVFGYVISAGIQVLITKEEMARAIGNRGLRQASLSTFFGFVSSSCSFAALAASRSVFVKGAHPANAITFLIASTNLVIELGIVLWLLVGWRFTLGNVLLGLFMIVYAYALTRIWLPKSLTDTAHENAEAAEQDGGMDMDGPMQGGWREKLLSREGWVRIAKAFVMEVRMVWKEILFGFTVAGFITVFVPQSFWDALFMLSGEGGQGQPGFLIVVENALIAPVVAFFTFIGSMGNVPLAAMLWSKGASFGGVMSFRGDRRLGPCEVLRLALCAVRLGPALRLHGGSGNHRPLPLLAPRPDPGGTAGGAGDGAVRRRPHAVPEHRLRGRRRHSRMALYPTEHGATGTFT